MRPPREPIFLARQSYRRRRVIDAARFLPFFAAFLMVVPVLWARLTSTSTGFLYVFGSWLVLILLAAVMSWRLRSVRIEDQDDEAGG